MPTVPASQLAAVQSLQQPSVEQLLMTAADMKSRGQLYQEPTDYSDPKAPLRLPYPGGGRGPRNPRSHGKRR